MLRSRILLKSSFRISSASFLFHTETLNFVNPLYINDSQHFIVTKSFYSTRKRSRESFRSIKAYVESRKRQYCPFTEMSLSIATDSPSSSSDAQGTSVCFQFWVFDYYLNKAVCPLRATYARQKRSVVELLRTFNDPRSNSSEVNEPKTKVRILNYNILSQALLRKHQYLYRKQKSYVLSWDYRKEHLVKEITTLNPDLFCLQEVEEDELPFFFRELESYGYKSVMKMKTRNRGDGLAIYYRHSSIRLVESDSVEFCQPGVIELESRDNVGLMARFEKDGKQFVVANTHLLYNPKRTEVRLAQLQLFLAEIHRFIRKGKGEEATSLFLMGDFNSAPESPVVQFLVNGKLHSNYKPLPPCLGITSKTVYSGESSKLFHSEKPYSEPKCQNQSIRPDSWGSSSDTSYVISHPFKFSSAYNLSSSESRGVTTFQDAWVMVDYIFYTSKGVEMVSRLGLPTASECDSYTHYLPNKFNPSDHLPLVADFALL